MRRFLPLVVSAAVGCASDDGERFDLVIRNGLVLDGTGVAGRVVDVGIRGDRITAIGPLDGSIPISSSKPRHSSSRPALSTCNADVVVFDADGYRSVCDSSSSTAWSCSTTASTRGLSRTGAQAR